jgi:aspartate racemase
MRKLGILGGVAWPSTIEYYRAICRLSVAHHAGKAVNGPPPVPEMSIESLNINRSFGLRGNYAHEASWASYDRYFREALLRLEASGANLAVIASATPHVRFEAITRGIRIPVLNIFEAIAWECARVGVRDLLILGTAPMMDSPAFPEVLSRFGIRGRVPEAGERAQVAALISELYAGRDDDAAARIRGVVQSSTSAGESADAVCLACTELPLAFPAIEEESSLVIDGILYLNSAMIHARAAFAASLEPRDRTPRDEAVVRSNQLPHAIVR